MTIVFVFVGIAWIACGLLGYRMAKRGTAQRVKERYGIEDGERYIPADTKVEVFVVAILGGPVTFFVALSMYGPRSLIAVLAIFCLCGLAAGSDCRRVSYVQQHYAVQQAVYPVVVPIAAYPAYHVSYGQNAQEMSALLAEIKALRGEVQSLKSASSVPPMPPANGGPPQTANALQVLTKQCARCHSGTAKAGGGFVMLEGNELAPLTDKQLRKMATQVTRQKMPPDTKLADHEFEAVIQWLDSIK